MPEETKDALSGLVQALRMVTATSAAFAGKDCEVSVGLVHQMPTGKEALRVRVRLRGRESVVETTVEELLRFESPAIALAEVARKAIEDLNRQ